MPSSPRSSRAPLAIALSALVLAFPAFTRAASAQSLTAACGPRDVTFNTSHGSAGDSTPGPSPGKATIYVVESYLLHDKGRFARPTVRVGLNGSWAGATQGLSYIRLDVPPGEHHLCTEWQSHLKILSDEIALYNLQTEAGKTYYLRIQISNAGAGDSSGPALIDLQPVSTDEGRYLVSIAAQSISQPK